MSIKSKPGYFIFIYCFLTIAGFAQLPPELINPEVVSKNRMPMRNTSFAYETMDKAKLFDKEKSANYFSLNGTWKFNWVKNPNNRPVNFFAKDFDDNSWENFRIPASWEVNGYGLPIYVNQRDYCQQEYQRVDSFSHTLSYAPQNRRVGSHK